MSSEFPYDLDAPLYTVDGQYVDWARSEGLDPALMSTVNRYHRFLDLML